MLIMNAEERKGSAKSQESPLTGARVLIIDDEQGFRDILSIAFSAAGSMPTTAAYGRAALELLRQSGSRFDLMMIDFTMPGMTFSELLGQIRRLPEYATTPIVVMSASFDNDLTADRRAQELGATGGMTKPFPHPTTFKAQLEEVVRTSLTQGIPA